MKASRYGEQSIALPLNLALPCRSDGRGDVLQNYVCILETSEF